MAYGPSYPALFRRAADYVDKYCGERIQVICQLNNPRSSN